MTLFTEIGGMRLAGEPIVGGMVLAVTGIGGTALAVTNAQFTTISNGMEISGTVAEQFGSVSCAYAWFMADPSNGGIVYLGGGTTVTTAGTADNTTTGYPLIAGDVIGPVPIDNINRIAHVSSIASQKLIYFAVS